jgi:formylglycine-generating enzyme required for sulfatase activity
MPSTSFSVPVDSARILLELKDARRSTDALFALLKPGAEYERPIAERHRIVFYIGHLEAFDWNLLRTDGRQSDLDRLFAFGIDPELGSGPTDTPADWPTIEQLRAYVTDRRMRVNREIESAEELRVHVAIEHRLMHAETLAYLFHRLERGTLPVLDQPNARSNPSRRREMVAVPAGMAELGCRSGFGWDNEFAPHAVEVPAFRIAKHKVTNGDYLAFVEEGAVPPPFWIASGRRWKYRGMFADLPLPLDWPVYVTHDQARAFAKWKGMRLMSEAEYHRASEGADPGGNLDFRQWDPVPVQDGPLNSLGISQMASNGWEWTSTPFAPFDGFEPFSFYPGYSANFFDGQHYVLKGASPRTAERLARPSFRNWFRHDYPYAYSTFRLAEDC